MKKIILIATIVATLTLISLSVLSQTSKNEDSLEINTESRLNMVYSNYNIPISIVFENKGDEPTRILNIFDKKRILPIFFSIEIINKNGESIFSTRGGKVEIPRDSMLYIELKKGETHTVTFDLQDLISLEDLKKKLKDNAIDIKNSEYKVAVIYRNQYGDNCFKGKLRSPEVWLDVEESK